MTDPPRLSFETLLDWVEDRLPPADAANVARYVAQASSEVRAEVAWLRAFRAASKPVQLAKPPPAVHAELVRRFAERASAPPSMLQRVVAVLAYDSEQQLLPAGVRAADTDTAQRQLVYATDQADVALNIVPGDEAGMLNVYGQVFPKTDLGNDVSVVLQRGGRDVALAPVDDIGEWMVASVASGTYSVIVSAAGVEITLDAVALHT